jgi:hypothetical protein
LPNLISVLPKEDYKLELKYDDGLEGEYPCGDLLTREEFNKLNDKTVFNSVTIDTQSNDVCWGKDMFLCKNALYKHLELQRLMKVFKIDLDKA